MCFVYYIICGAEWQLKYNLYQRKVFQRMIRKVYGLHFFTFLCTWLPVIFADYSFYCNCVIPN